MENATGKKSNIVITNDKGHLTKEQIQNMIADGEKFKEQDEKMRAAIAAKNELEAYVYHMKSMVHNLFLTLI